MTAIKINGNEIFGGWGQKLHKKFMHYSGTQGKKTLPITKASTMSVNTMQQ
jgi:hypothetical protein